MSLDIETLYFTSAVSRSAYLVVFFVTALRQPRDAYHWHWIAALLCSMIGLLILSDIPATAVPSVPASLAIYLFCGASLSLSWSGLRLFYGREPRLPLVGGLTVLPALSYGAALAMGARESAALGIVFSACMILSGLSIREIARTSRGDRLWSQYVVALAFFLYFAIFAVSIVSVGLIGVETRTVESGRLSIIVDQVTGILIYFGYLAMATERATLGLRRLAETDLLTGLANRRGLEAAQVQGRIRTGGGVLLADIDHFKAINDAHGHLTGDKVLEDFAVRLKAALTADDIAVRWGGEEFLAVLPGKSALQAVAIGERLRALVAAEPFDTPSGPIRVTVSIGIAAMDPGERTIEPATRRADAALYLAKSAGRNRVVRAEDPSAGQSPPHAMPSATLAAVA